MKSAAIERFRRSELERCIEKMISLLDMMDGDCDLEDGADEEPSLSVRPSIINGRPEYDLEADPAESGIADQEAFDLIMFTDTNLRQIG
ncbi:MULTISPECIES: hypothetical protein [unclassified Shinella]|jgi:hypothetical protein|uniref:hypothetical protein n=1 Tax=unclassified Shinella TaxID=2643062 RepID=UPI000417B8F0|nr:MULTISPECIES: hypothetical protein [unclassified Shinella]MCA0342444.1 hypothetical protein [Pseudomonadota bacterium]EYR82903.1 hypothetical protein SHLA_18c001080 [Shinella sp. DD12]KNY13770.1 hypothetical protein AKG11_27650 [Shinella sp. SUS2]KOC72662.1 hypothetical protein AKG10_26520 [Shinella sp. GWS1]MCO5148654.1 hypothetical protein [Shinella sp.]